MAETLSEEELGREVARQGSRGGEAAASSVEGPGGADAPVVSRERVRELSERLDGLIEEGGRGVIRLGAFSGLLGAGMCLTFGLSGDGVWYFWLAPLALLAGVGITWASWRWRLRKMPPPGSEAAPSLDAELGALRERFDAFMPSPGALMSTSIKIYAGLSVVGGLALALVGIGLWTAGVLSFGVGMVIGGVASCLGSLLLLGFARHYDRVAELGEEISAMSRARDRSLGSDRSVALGERLALENELDELRSERKKWLQTAVVGGGAMVAYPFLMSDVADPRQLVGNVVFAVVFVVLLLVPVVRKRSHIRELERRLEGLDEEEGSGAPRVGEGRSAGAARHPVSRDGTEAV